MIKVIISTFSFHNQTTFMGDNTENSERKLNSSLTCSHTCACLPVPPHMHADTFKDNTAYKYKLYIPHINIAYNHTPLQLLKWHYSFSNLKAKYSVIMRISFNRHYSTLVYQH